MSGSSSQNPNDSQLPGVSAATIVRDESGCGLVQMLSVPEDFSDMLVRGELRTVNYDLKKLGLPPLSAGVLTDLGQLPPSTQWKCLSPPLYHNKLGITCMEKRLRERMANGGAFQWEIDIAEKDSEEENDEQEESNPGRQMKAQSSCEHSAADAPDPQEPPATRQRVD